MRLASARGIRPQSQIFCDDCTRLIADVVTGKLDVREAAARLPEGAGEVLEPHETAGFCGEEERL